MLSKKISAEKLLINGRIGFIPTDTIYGVAASALSEKSVMRAYKVLERNPQKPFIILISSLKDLTLFGIKLEKAERKILGKLWPGKISVVLPVTGEKFRYLHRRKKSLAFRIPGKNSLIKLLKKTGPLISTSANPEGKRPAETVSEAKSYFDGNIDFYVSSGKIKSLPSTLVEIKNGKIRVLRKGTAQIPKYAT